MVKKESKRYLLWDTKRDETRLLKTKPYDKDINPHEIMKKINLVAEIPERTVEEISTEWEIPKEQVQASLIDTEPEENYRTMPNKENFAKKFADKEVAVECENCGKVISEKPRVSQHTNGVIGFQLSSYCEECCNEEPVRKLFVRELSATELNNLKGKEEVDEK